MKTQYATLPGYKVEYVEAESFGPVVCDYCDWKGPLKKVAPIDTCVLNAGDPSPAGRCPKCDVLVYPTSKLKSC